MEKMSSELVELVELVKSFESAPVVSDVAKSCVGFLKKFGNRDQAHGRLCCAMIERADGGNAELSKLLHFYGEAEVLVVTYNNIAHAK